jgi:hypothetical protein
MKFCLQNHEATIWENWVQKEENKRNLKESRYETMGWIEQAEDSVQRQAFVKMKIHRRALNPARVFTSYVTINFSRETLHQCS